MGSIVRLTADDGHTLDAYRAAPPGVPGGGVVIVQEIFGLTASIRRVADSYAAHGYFAVAPALFDRIEPELVLDYDDVSTARAYMQQLAWPDALGDVAAALADVRQAGPTAVIGFCWGGTVVHLAAAELEVDAAVSYYGTRVVQFLDRRPRCPILYHFGDQDRSIPPEDVERIRAAYPEALVHVYEGAGHGFACEDRASHDPGHSRSAFERSLAFLDARLAAAR